MSSTRKDLTSHLRASTPQHRDAAHGLVRAATVLAAAGSLAGTVAAAWAMTPGAEPAAAAVVPSTVPAAPAAVPARSVTPPRSLTPQRSLTAQRAAPVPTRKAPVVRRHRRVTAPPPVSTSGSS